MKIKKSQQEREIQTIKNSIQGLLLFWGIAVIASVFILASGQHPKQWQEKEIVIQEITTMRKFKGRYYQITDENGNTFSINSTNKNVEKLVSGEHYRIIHSSIHHNQIQFMTDQDENQVFVDYDTSVRDYYARQFIGWPLLLGSSGMILPSLFQSYRRILQLQKQDH